MAQILIRGSGGDRWPSKFFELHLPDVYKRWENNNNSYSKYIHIIMAFCRAHLPKLREGVEEVSNNKAWDFSTEVPSDHPLFGYYQKKCEDDCAEIEKLKSEVAEAVARLESEEQTRKRTRDVFETWGASFKADFFREIGGGAASGSAPASSAMGDAAARQKIADLEADKASLQAQVTALKAELVQARQDHGTMTRRVNALQNEINTTWTPLKTELDALKAQIQQSRDDFLVRTRQTDFQLGVLHLMHMARECGVPPTKLALPGPGVNFTTHIQPWVDECTNDPHAVLCEVLSVVKAHWEFKFTAGVVRQNSKTNGAALIKLFQEQDKANFAGFPLLRMDKYAGRWLVKDATGTCPLKRVTFDVLPHISAHYERFLKSL